MCILTRIQYRYLPFTGKSHLTLKQGEGEQLDTAPFFFLFLLGPLLILTFLGHLHFSNRQAKKYKLKLLPVNLDVSGLASDINLDISDTLGTMVLVEATVLSSSLAGTGSVEYVLHMPRHGVRG